MICYRICTKLSALVLSPRSLPLPEVSFRNLSTVLDAFEPPQRPWFFSNSPCYPCSPLGNSGYCFLFLPPDSAKSTRRKLTINTHLEQTVVIDNRGKQHIRSQCSGLVLKGCLGTSSLARTSQCECSQGRLHLSAHGHCRGLDMARPRWSLLCILHS